jgi:hypothetical protein
MITAESVGLINREKDNVTLTKEGQELGRALASKNLEEQRKILSISALKNPVMEFVYSMIKEKRIMKNKEIGQKIAMQFNKNWKHELSYSRYGTNCGDILSAAGLGDYYNGIYSSEKISSSDISEGTSPPALRFNKILKIITELSAKEKNLDILTQKLATKKNRLFSELSNCVDLGLVKKSGDIYAITELGRSLINPLNTTETTGNIFAEVLRKSPYAGVIKISEENSINDKKKLGQILLHELRREGGDSYQRMIGNIFGDWLDSAGLTSTSKNRVKISVDKNSAQVIKKVNEVEIKKPVIKSDSTKTMVESTQKNTIYNIGRLLERIDIKISMKKDIEQDLQELLIVCKKDASLTFFHNMLVLHLSLYLENKDFRIIEADLNYLKSQCGN